MSLDKTGGVSEQLFVILLKPRTLTARTLSGAVATGLFGTGISALGLRRPGAGELLRVFPSISRVISRCRLLSFPFHPANGKYQGRVAWGNPTQGHSQVAVRSRADTHRYGG